MVKGIKKQASAIDPQFVNPHLPSKKAEYLRAQVLADMFSPTKRAGAGGVKVGVPGIRPSGSQVFKDFHEMTSTGRNKKKAGMMQAPVEDLSQHTKREMAQNVKYWLPRNFCADCDRVNRPESGGTLNMHFYDKDMPHLRLKANQGYLSSFCQECCMKHMKASRNPVKVMGIKGETSLAQIHAEERKKRIEKNTQSFIKVMLMTGREEDILWSKVKEGRT